MIIILNQNFSSLFQSDH